jgi:hypothetical protein
LTRCGAAGKYKKTNDRRALHPVLAIVLGTRRGPVELRKGSEGYFSSSLSIFRVVLSSFFNSSLASII